MNITSSNNPIIKGYFADPDIIAYNNTYYLYPTTDGNHWKGTQFQVFSSTDLTHWKSLGTIFDFSTADIKWADNYAWAPAIAEKNGKFYFYYCADKQIGVAVSNHPLGPFTNVSVHSPLIGYDSLPKSVSLDQLIDPYVFVDEDNSAYMYFGNGYNPAVVELNEDMLSVKPHTMKNMSFNIISDFREAIMVFKKNGTYHFTWSCDDTRSENYHINYGVSHSPIGPIEVKGTILSKDPSKGIYATGHHSIIKAEDSNDYFIVYHRFSTNGSKAISGEERGYHRELCIDRLLFDDNGYIVRVIPT